MKSIPRSAVIRRQSIGRRGRRALIVTITSWMVSAVFAGQWLGAQEASSSVSSVAFLELVTPDLSSANDESRDQLNAARQELEQLVAASAPSSIVAEKLSFLGELYLAYGFEEAAFETLTQVTELAPSSWRTHYVLGYLGERRGDQDAAIRALELAASHLDDEAGAHVAALTMRLGRLLLESGNDSGATRQLEAALAADRSCVAASYGLAQVALRSGDAEQAVELYRGALETAPGSAQLRYALGMALRDLGQIGEARELLASAAADAGASASGWSDCADPVLAEVGSLVQGAGAHLRRAMYAYRAGDFGLEHEELLLAVAAAPDSANAQRRLAATYTRRGEFESASKHFRLSLELEPSHAATHYDLAEVLRAAGQLDEARERYLEAVELSADFVDPRIRLGDLAFSAGRIDEAIEHYTRVFELSEENDALRVPYALSLVRAGQRDLGLEQLTLALDRAPPQDPAQHLQLTEMLLILGAVDAAVERLELFLDPQVAPGLRARASMWLGSVAIGRGEIAVGRERLETALELDPTLEQARQLLEEAG